MRAAIFNPYLDTLGGGERYAMSFARVLSELGWSVDVEWRNPEIKRDFENRFGLDLKEINFIPDTKRGDGYDLCFWVSDGSIPILKARKNLLHFQVPFHHIGGNNLLNKMKFIRIDKIICNSLFTKKFIDHEYGVESVVVYPPVPVDRIKPKRKGNIILSVSRFSQLKQSKHQDVLIKAFKKMVDYGLKDWKLILAGGVEVGVGDYIEKLERLAEGYPIEIIKSPNFKTIVDMYGKAKIFWSASGFGEDEEKNPENVEHFGIAVVEAMAGGAIPVVFNTGGHKEIVEDGSTGFLWNSETELRKKTKSIINGKIHYSALRKNSILRSQKFSYEKFKEETIRLLD